MLLLERLLVVQEMLSVLELVELLYFEPALLVQESLALELQAVGR